MKKNKKNSKATTVASQKSPTIINLDIETAPTLGYVWGMYEQNVLEVKEDFIILSTAIYDVNTGKTRAYSLPDFKLYKKDKLDDRELVMAVWEELDKADIVVGHHIDNFDIKKLNVRFLKHGLTPPSPFRTIDTKKLAKKHFMFDSNKLDELARFLGIGRKLQTKGKDTWFGCMKGDMASWKDMVKYNIHDVILDNEVYNFLSPWATGGINFATMTGEDMVCTRVGCGSKRLQSRGDYTSGRGVGKRYQCQDCGKWMQGPAHKIVNIS